MTNRQIADLLENSDLDDFIPSDEDGADEEFVVRESEQSGSSSSSSDSENENQSHGTAVAPATFSLRGRRSARTRGRSTRRSSGRPMTQRNTPLTSGTTTQVNWSVKSFPSKEFSLTQPAYKPIDTEGFTKLQYFNLYIDNDLVDLIVQKTNQTSVLRTGKSLDLTRQECYVYIGICLVIASINYPSIRMYWEFKSRYAVIADAMSRNRFLTLRNSLKLVFDPNITAEQRENDKIWRVRPLADKIRTACQANAKNECLSIDEMIIPFTGHCGIRTYCPGKPNPVGIKAFVLANPNGMVCDFHIYQSSPTTYPEFENSELLLPEKAVLALTETLVPGHIIYCDRFFTTENLLDKLHQKGLACTGTLMKNRIPKDARALLLSDKELKKKGRGTSQVVVRKDEMLAVTKWFDNKPVTLMSSVEAQDEEDLCRRWCKKGKKYEMVKRPRCVRQYNKNMGGVDLADRLLAVCPNRYRTRKWTQRFISHMLDLAVSNCWLLYKEVQQQNRVRKIEQLRAFKLQLGEVLIESNSPVTPRYDEDDDDEALTQMSNDFKRTRGTPATPLPSKKRRTTASEHMPKFSDTQGRCRLCHENKTFFLCSTCNIRLCLTKKRNCYSQFHCE